MARKQPAHVSAGALLQRFKGPKGHRFLLAALREEKMVAGNEDLARDLAAAGKLVAVKAGTIVIEQGGRDNHVFLILAGAFDIVVNGKKVNKRQPCDHIGEMAAIQPSQIRSASVVATEDSVLLKISHPQLTALGKRHPEIYSTLAKELSRRLLQRNEVLAAKRDKIHILIVSSPAALGVARAVQKGLDGDSLAVLIWKDGAFRASPYAIENLERELDRCDFAIAIAQHDGSTAKRKRVSPRDNVIFELGLFIGRLGRHRALLLEPRGEQVDMPPDLTGLSTVFYSTAPGRGMAGAVSPACARIREIVEDLGPNI